MAFTTNGKALRTNGRTLRHKRDYMNFMKRYYMELGIPFWNARYKKWPQMTTQEVKFMCMDVMKNDTEVAQRIFDAPDWIDSRILGLQGSSEKSRYVSTSTSEWTKNKGGIWKKGRHYLNDNE